MNSRIESEVETGPEGGNDQVQNDTFASLVQMMSESPLALLIGPRSEATSRFARAAAVACAGLRNRPADGKCGDVVVIFDQWSGDPLVALRDAIATAVDSATGVLVTRPHPDPRTLAVLLVHWAERFGANFIVVLDRYERNLAAEPLNARNARFAEQLAEAIAQASVHTRFLVVVSEESEATLVRLTARLGSPCRSLVRLAPAPAMTNRSTRPQRPSDAAASQARTSDEPLPDGFSALADDRVDLSVTQAILRRRERRKSIVRWRNFGVAAALLVAAAAGIALLMQLQQPDPGARLARALDPQPSPIVPAPSPATSAEADKTTPLTPPPAEVATKSSDTVKADEAPPTLATAPHAAEIPPPQPAPPPATTSPAPLAADRVPATVPAPPVTGFEPHSPTPTAAPAPSVEAVPTATPKPDPLPSAFRIDAPPGPPVPAKFVRAVANPDKEPMLFIHIRSESQRSLARSIASGLARLNIVVSGIRVDESGPLRGDLRYYRSGERDEANYLARATGRLGAPALRVTQVAGHEAVAVPRHYELWLPPPTH